MEFNLSEARRRLTDAFPLVNDHPDVAGVLRDPGLLQLVGAALAEPFRSAGVELVLAPEARGPIVGALVARELDAGLVIVRKDDGNHPGADLPVQSEPNWTGRAEVFKGRSFDLRSGQRVLIVDDWITTGNTIRATRTIADLMGATTVGASVVVNKSTPETIDELCVHWLVDFEEIAGV